MGKRRGSGLRQVALSPFRGLAKSRKGACATLCGSGLRQVALSPFRGLAKSRKGARATLGPEGRGRGGGGRDGLGG